MSMNSVQSKFSMVSIIEIRNYNCIDFFYSEYLFIYKYLCSIKLGSIECNLETAKIGILLWENMSTTIAKLPKSEFAHL